MLSFSIAFSEFFMGQVLIRNLDDEVIEALKLKAEINGKSLEQELRDILASAAPLTAHEKVAMAQRFQADLELPDDFDVGLAIRLGRDDEEEYRSAQGHAPGKKASQG
jgi:plasmid stability protein